MIDHESLFQAIKNCRWNFIIDTLYQNRKDISSDPLLTNAALTFENEYLKIVSDDGGNTFLPTMELLWLLDSGGFYKISNENRKKLIYQIVKRKDPLSEEAYKYSKLYPELEICRSIIENFEKSLPKTVSHSQSERIQVVEVNSSQEVDYTINLFKSEQELEFYKALTITFPTYQIYPNVSISCLLNYSLLKTHLSSEEIEYFFRGIIDVVVFDQGVGYRPVHFFELDSIFHDSHSATKKDRLKDSILRKAGIKLFRIRKQDGFVKTDQFVKMIREIVKES